MISFFHKIVDVLNKENIPYMLFGSVAMALYVVPRATRDFDFIIQLQPQDVERFVANFQQGYYCDADGILDAVKHRSLFNILDFSSGFKADFVILKNEPFRQKEFSRKIKDSYFGKTIYVESAEDLLLSKIIWIQELQSALQITDIKALCGVRTLDWVYINQWIKYMNLKTFNLFPND